MNSFLFKSLDLLTGQYAPVSGVYNNAGQARQISCLIYVTGIGTGTPQLILDYPHPFNPGGLSVPSGVPFYTRTLTNGSYHVAITGLPVPYVRAIINDDRSITGQRNIRTWVRLYQQN